MFYARFSVVRRPRRTLAAFAIAVGMSATALVNPAGAADSGNVAEEVKSFLTTGDVICKDSNEKLADAALAFERHIMLERKTAKSKRQKIAKPNDVAEFITKYALKELTGQVDALEKNVAPASKSIAFKAAIASARKALAEMKKDPKKAAITNPYKFAAQQFRDMGFQECGRTVEASEGA